MDGPTGEVTAHYLDKANQLYSVIMANKPVMPYLLC